MPKAPIVLEHQKGKLFGAAAAAPYLSSKQKRALYTGPVLPKSAIDVMAEESDQHRLSQRQKQIDFGKNTRGYQLYTNKVPRNLRTRGQPRTPDTHMKCSKRTWDAVVRKWRRDLHAFDDAPTQPLFSGSSQLDCCADDDDDGMRNAAVALTAEDLCFDFAEAGDGAVDRLGSASSGPTGAGHVMPPTDTAHPPLAKTIDDMIFDVAHEIDQF